LAEGAARWKLATTLRDLRSAVLLAQDPDTKNRLTTVLETFKTALADETIVLRDAVSENQKSRFDVQECDD
jgi:hypothetical protein